MSKEKQIDKEEEMWFWMKNIPMFKKLHNDVTKLAIVEIKKVLDLIRADAAAIGTSGQTGEQVKQIMLDIIDTYKEEFEGVR